MIADGAITYGGRNEGILTWRFSNDVANELAIAALLTILSYQVAEMIINLFLGFKRPGQARLRDLHIILLIRKFSPMSVLRSIYTWNCRRRRKARGDEEEGQDEELEESRSDERAISILAYVKLVLLLIAIPLVNVGTVVLSFERDTTLTFAQANFGGVAMGLDESETIERWFPLSRTPNSFCEGTALATNAAEFAIAEFYACILDLSDVVKATPPRNDTIRVTVRLSQKERVVIEVHVGSHRVDFMKRLIVLTRNSTASSSADKNSTASSSADKNGTASSSADRNDTASDDRNLFFVRHNVSEAQAQTIIRRGIELASEHCDSVGEPQDLRDDNKEQNEVTLGQVAVCERNSERSEREDAESANEVVFKLLDLLSFVNNDKLEVRDGSEDEMGPLIAEELFPGDDLLLLKRRRGFASIPVLAIAAFGAVGLRILSELITRNDLERGIGLIVRDGLGLPCCDSMLCSTDVVVRYNRRGNVLHSVERQSRSAPSVVD